MSYLKPGALTQIAGKVISALRVKPTVTVVGRRSGQPRSVPVNVLEHEGKRYLVSPRGETEWARNLRAAGQCQLRTRGKLEDLEATEVADDQKPELIVAYREHWELETKRYWEALPDPSDHPIFELAEPEPA